MIQIGPERESAAGRDRERRDWIPACRGGSARGSHAPLCTTVPTPSREKVDALLVVSAYLSGTGMRAARALLGGYGYGLARRASPSVDTKQGRPNSLLNCHPNGFGTARRGNLVMPLISLLPWPPRCDHRWVNEHLAPLSHDESPPFHNPGVAEYW